MSARIRRGLLCAVAAALGNCAVYNDPCRVPVENPNEQIALIAPGEEIFIDKPNARHAPNALGQAVADAFVDAFGASGTPADFGVENGGALRSESACGAVRTTLSGSLSDGELHEILLFENLVGSVALSEKDVIAMFENSASKLVASPAPISAPNGRFLQVSKEVSVEIDCSKQVGQRVTRVRVGAGDLSPTGTRMLRVAASLFLLGGGDGYDGLKAAYADVARNPIRAPKFGGIDSSIAEDYFRRAKKTAASPISIDAARMKLVNCSLPPKPSG